MSETFKVKVIKSSSPIYWYADKIGEIYEVRHDENFVLVDNPLDGFQADDCEIIEHKTENLEISKVMSFANWIGNERLYYSEVEGWWKLENGCIKNVAINTEVLLELFLTTNKID